jgi:hypothetical protein
MTAGRWGSWETYTQVVTGLGLNDVLTGFSAVSLGVDAYLIATSPYQSPQVFEDANARQCAMRHVQNGSSVSATWNVFSTCPPMTPAFSSWIGVPFECGLGVFYAGGAGSYSRVEVAGMMTAFGTIANKRITPRGVQSWADQHGDNSAPPVYDTADGRLWKWDYDVFTDLDVTATMDTSVMSSSTPLEWTMRGVEVTVPTAGVPSESWTWTPVQTWNPTADGALTWEAIISPSGISAVGSVTVPCPNILGNGHVWQFVPDLVAPGFFFSDDPHTAGFGFASWAAWVRPAVHYTVQRTGRRRRWLTTAPPLQQRQRSDGLGGGPNHAGRGIATRQHGLHQAGIY